MSDLSRYDGCMPEPPYPPEQEDVEETVFTFHVNEALCENCGTISTDGTCHCTEDDREPLWRPHDRKAIETISSLRQQLEESNAHLAQAMGTIAELRLETAQERELRTNLYGTLDDLNTMARNVCPSLLEDHHLAGEIDAALEAGKAAS